MAATTNQLFKEVSAKKLYKDLLLLARFYGQRQGNEKVLLTQVRQQFKANVREVDDDKIRDQKEAAVRALHNIHLLEAERYVSKSKGTNTTKVWNSIGLKNNANDK